MTTTPQTLTLAGADYVVILRDEYERLRAAADEDAADVAAIQRILDDPQRDLGPGTDRAPHCRRGTPRARLAHAPRHDRPRAPSSHPSDENQMRGLTHRMIQLPPSRRQRADRTPCPPRSGRGVPATVLPPYLALRGDPDTPPSLRIPQLPHLTHQVHIVLTRGINKRRSRTRRTLQLRQRIDAVPNPPTAPLRLQKPLPQ